MSDVLLFWSCIWLALFVIFSIILYKEKRRKLYFLYFIFGMIFGFYFDYVSVFFGYYTYPELFIGIYGVPLSVTIAEGFSIAITVWMFEILKGVLKNAKIVRS